ncbi:uncharacterized protein Z519_12261 [Cladophialophora bantiana CBS 173.52]|uniref:Major facilitator superfamily (MFS) profile domain-containing protein n=1 Tax=Cladophialophora bantiana (strain ATCC 10958 / CBS 173.52 / CDC B-1940 / NIH 8579) TaxID=1442370 RepID=A0A0D2H8D4_CLAB1|nr:uncharacterized protein Z519_12261 [Cladophialophora bantiana CBS 173.52]KIW87150.1 hypothetical protein Z519_12261 [Cladophialophora bantiana CBS 173.52]
MTLVDEPEPVHWNPVKACLLILSLTTHYICELLFIVGSGVYARDIAEVVGGAEISSWCISAVTILTAAFAPPIAQAADFWGRKWLLVVPTFLGFIGSIVVATAQSMQVAIIGFAIGGASFGAQPLVHAVASEILPRKHRSYAQSTVNSSIGVGAIIALTVGSALTNNNPAGFRTYWYLCAGLYVFSSVAMALLYNPAPRELQLTMTFGEKIRALDWIGFLLFNAGLVTFCVGLSYSQNPFPWTNAHVLAPFLTGVVILATLVLYEVKFKKDGLFHHGLFQHRNFPIAVTAVAIEGLVFVAASNYYPFEMATVLAGRISSFRVAVCFAIAFVALFAIANVVGAYIHRTKTVRGPAMASFVGFIIFGAVSANIKSSTPEAHFWGFVIFYGIGLGICLITLLTMAQLATPPELISITSGLMASMRSFGGAVGVAIQLAIFNSGLNSNLVPQVTAAVEPLGLNATSIGPLIAALGTENRTLIQAVPGVNQEIIEAAETARTDAFVIGFRDVWISVAAFAAFGIFICYFVKNPKAEFNSSIDAPLEGTARVRELEKPRVSIRDSDTSPADMGAALE